MQYISVLEMKLKNIEEDHNQIVDNLHASVDRILSEKLVSENNLHAKIVELEKKNSELHASVENFKLNHDKLHASRNGFVKAIRKEKYVFKKKALYNKTKKIWVPKGTVPNNYFAGIAKSKWVPKSVLNCIS
jgi:hypothetical protein